mmetsp:Transcript_99438/g.192050  ORF Transcript_99438/g.192050 Transcript_99438/m.192050 type:complete len:88 (+) Transcript_99438:100-363(+)
MDILFERDHDSPGGSVAQHLSPAIAKALPDSARSIRLVLLDANGSRERRKRREPGNPSPRLQNVLSAKAPFPCIAALTNPLLAPVAA